MSEEWCVVCDCVTVECAVERSEVDVRTGGGWEEDGSPYEYKEDAHLPSHPLTWLLPP